MKQQRRHELQTNKLADELGHYIEDVRPYTSHILFGVAAVAALIVVLLWWNGSRTRSLGAAWGDYFEAATTREVTALDEVTKLHPGTPAAVWAHLSAGEMTFSRGAGLMFRDRDQAEDVLNEAEQHYMAAIDGGAAKYPWLMERAQFGLAQVYESQSELDKAITYYQAAAAINGESVIGKTSQQRADLLAETDVEGWYNWFDRQEPSLPSHLEPLPDRPDLSFPSSDLPASIGDITPGDLSPTDLTPGDLSPEDDSSLDMDLTAPGAPEASEASEPAPEAPTVPEADTSAAPEAPAAPEAAAPEAPASTEEDN